MSAQSITNGVFLRFTKQSCAPLNVLRKEIGSKAKDAVRITPLFRYTSSNQSAVEQAIQTLASKQSSFPLHLTKLVRGEKRATYNISYSGQTPLQAELLELRANLDNALKGLGPGITSYGGLEGSPYSFLAMVHSAKTGAKSDAILAALEKEHGAVDGETYGPLVADGLYLGYHKPTKSSPWTTFAFGSDSPQPWDGTDMNVD